MYKCKTCGKRMRLTAAARYEIVDKPIGLAILTEKPKIFEAFDCPRCGCQNIVNIREPKYIYPDTGEEGKNSD